jgi:Domain of unknown function (DUF4383)
MTSGRAATQWLCLVGGAILLVRGGVGVALDPEFASPGEGWHQLIHLASGVLLLAASVRAATATAFLLGFGVLYAGVAVAGIADGADVAGVIPVQGGDNVLHALLAAASLGTVALASRRVSRAAA